MSNFEFWVKKIICLQIFFGAVACSLYAQADEELSSPPVFKEALSPDAYTFSIKLPPDTDCTAQVKFIGGEKSTNVEESTLDVMKLERLIRSGLSSSIEIKKEGAKMTFYFVNGWCAYEHPKKGLNIRRNLSGFSLSNLAIYHFPELQWATPETRQSDPVKKEGIPQVHIYKDGVFLLEVDADSGYPLRYSDGQMKWTYSYKKSSSPIVMPENIKAALSNSLNSSQRAQ